MNGSTTFDNALDAVEHLSLEQQVDLVAIVQRRLAARGREQVASDIRDGRLSHQSGQAAAASVADLMREIES
jgi:hypothetical protein